MSNRYVHGYASEEQERLVEQAEHWREELILSGTKLAPGTRLLEVGCGVGAVLGILGDAFPGVVLSGVDIEDRQLGAARAHLADLGLQADLRKADATALPYEDASFDHVWMMWFLEHVPDPVAALKEARRVLVPGGRITAIEVDYNSVWTSPETDTLRALFDDVARTMEANGRSDTGARLEDWLVEARFGSVDPGERRLHYSGGELFRQLPYVAAVVESTLGTQHEAGLAELKTLATRPGAALGFTVYKTTAEA